MALVWKSIREFYQIMITYSSEQKFDLKYSWKILHKSGNFKTSGNNMTGEDNKCHLRSFLVAQNKNEILRNPISEKCSLQ